MLAWHLRRSREERYAGEIRPALSHLRKDQHLECWVPDEMLEHWASEYAQIPGVAEMKTKKTSIRGTMVDIESELARMPVEDKPYERFDAAMKQILSVSKAELQRRMEAEKQSKATASHVPASHAKRD